VKSYIRLGAHIYGFLLRLYPRSFRIEYEEEMKAVFLERTEDALHVGWFVYAVVLLQELRHLSLYLVLEHRKALRQQPEPSADDRGGVEGAQTNTHLRTTPHRVQHYESWPETVLAAGPILLIAIGSVLATYLPYLQWQVLFGISLILVLLAALGLAWVRGFPAWSYVYVIPIAGVTLLGIFMTIVTGDMLNLIVPGGVVLTLAAAIWLSGLVRPLRQLIQGVWQDWTLLAFGMYGLLGVVTTLVFDDANYNDQTPYYALAVVTGFAGGLFFLRSSRPWMRMASLLGAVTLVVVAGALDHVHFAEGSFSFQSHGWMVSVWLISLSLIAFPAFALGAIHYALLSGRSP
jgi:hypothetical protein